MDHGVEVGGPTVVNEVRYALPECAQFGGLHLRQIPALDPAHEARIAGVTLALVWRARQAWERLRSETYEQTLRTELSPASGTLEYPSVIGREPLEPGVFPAARAKLSVSRSICVGRCDVLGDVQMVSALPLTYSKPLSSIARPIFDPSSRCCSSLSCSSESRTESKASSSSWIGSRLPRARSVSASRSDS